MIWGPSISFDGFQKKVDEWKSTIFDCIGCEHSRLGLWDRHVWHGPDGKGPDIVQAEYTCLDCKMRIFIAVNLSDHTAFFFETCSYE